MITSKDSKRLIQQADAYKELLNQDPFKTLHPENDLEFELLNQPKFIKGLEWGVPRFGHPEGKVLLHVKEVLENIDQLQLAEKDRSQLRIISFAHDTFKYLEEKGNPRDWSKHHGAIARRFMEKFIDEEDTLDIIELHDEAYHVWCLQHYHKQPDAALRRLDDLMERIDGKIQVYYNFFKVDTRTGDKNQAPLEWFEKNFGGFEPFDF
jgi:hypothetical protein